MSNFVNTNPILSNFFQHPILKTIYFYLFRLVLLLFMSLTFSSFNIWYLGTALISLIILIKLTSIHIFYGIFLLLSLIKLGFYQSTLFPIFTELEFIFICLFVKSYFDVKQKNQEINLNELIIITKKDHIISMCVALITILVWFSFF